MPEKWVAYDRMNENDKNETIFCRGEDFDNTLKPYEIVDRLNALEKDKQLDIELTEVYEDGALVIVEGDDWIVAIPFTLSDNKTTIDVEDLL